ncbi:hypothetical protein M426DRAFT_19337 [Hypoxylon sp. CI-4A]|nr:hypothetical protein M426DRAFT_19337 [Hypoxylon sp. CI-4A]
MSSTSIKFVEIKTAQDIDKIMVEISKIEGWYKGKFIDEGGALKPDTQEYFNKILDWVAQHWNNLESAQGNIPEARKVHDAKKALRRLEAGLEKLKRFSDIKNAQTK